ncbi:MAG: TolC family protein [Magnetococcales bacterium]|nr:TolC family protein [Magnetococcales bacterium]
MFCDRTRLWKTGLLIGWLLFLPGAGSVLAADMLGLESPSILGKQTLVPEPSPPEGPPAILAEREKSEAGENKQETSWTLLSGPEAQDMTLSQALTRMLEQHQRIKAAEADLQAAIATLAKTRTGYFPELKMTTDSGREVINNANTTPDTAMPMRHMNLTVNQMLWDFGKAKAEVGKAEISVRQLQNNVELARQDLLLEGITASINLLRAHQTLEFAQQSVDNIQKQAGLEESRVDLGSGFPTDVLQAKSQLAGAQARHSRAKGGLVNAMNRYRAVFNAEPPVREKLHALQVPQSQLPATLEELIHLTRSDNLQLKNAGLSEELAGLDVDRVLASDLAPKLNLIGESKFSRNDNGTEGNKESRSIKMELSYALNFGLPGLDAMQVARKQKLAVSSRKHDTMMTVDEQARNAWQNLVTARENADFLANQVRIAMAYLRLAQEERVQGRRSLIDVLSGETTVINAQSDAAAAESDVVIAAYTILKVVGRLALATVQ